jgi:hypothetical protein
MSYRSARRAAAVLLVAGGTLGFSRHVTPPVVLMSDQEALRGALTGSERYFVREVKLSAAERASLRKRWNWTADETFYRFFLGREADGSLVAAAVFLTEATIHGPVRIVVALNPDGTVRRGTRVVELTEETFPWMKPVLDRGFLEQYVGHSSDSSFALGQRFEEMRLSKMPRFYAQLVGRMTQRGAALYRVKFPEQKGSGS